MKFSLVFVFLFTILNVKCVFGKVYTRCELARELLRHAFPLNLLENWVCLVEAESERNMKFKRGPFKKGDYKWGLFQIHDLLWCNPYMDGGICNVNCHKLLNNVTESAKCAKIVYHYFGFSQWDRWIEKCMGLPLPRLDNCGIRV